MACAGLSPLPLSALVTHRTVAVPVIGVGYMYVRE